MPTLAFKVQADYEKVMRLREEIHKLKEEMKGVDAVNNPHQFNVLNQNLQKCTKEYNNLTTEAVKAGTQIESGFKKKIYDAQQVVNKFSEDIMAQKKIVFDTAEEFRNLTARYNELRRQGKKMSAEGMVPQLNRVKSALDEQKRSLFELTQERSKSQLGLKKLREEYQLFAKESGASTGILAKLKQEITGLGMSMMAGWGLKELGAQIIRVRGQFQQADTAIQTLLGSKERADELLAQVREYAKISPLEFGDITRVTQMMLGFNIEAEKVPGFIKAIGDVSMGEAGRFNSLALAFSQMTAAGKLMGQDLLQMINAGFNPLTVIAEKTGKSVAQLKEEMSKGAITAEMVQQAFMDATSAGGKFFNMSENAAKTINGQLSMMHDALDSAMNEVGKASEGVIVESISGVTKLIESYETVGRVLLGLATTYGTYRTAIALVTFAENGHTLSMTLARTQILLTQKAQSLLNATMLANPYVLAAVALGGLVGTLIATSDGLTASERAQKDFNATIDEGTRKQQEYNAEVEKAIATASNDAAATNDRRSAMNLLIERYPEIIKKYIDEEGHLKNILQLKREIAAVDGQRNYENLKNTAQRYKDAAEAAKLMINGKKLTEEQKQLLSEVKQEYFDKNNWQAKALYNDKDLLGYTEQMSKDYSKKADRTNVENNIKKYQDTITKFSKDQLTHLQSVLQNAKTKGERVSFKGVAGLEGLVLNQSDIANLDTYVGGLLKSKDETITKKTLSDRKKKLQAELDALSYEEAAGKKGAALKKKIEAIDKQLGAYSTKSKSNGGAANAGERTESITRQQKVAQVRAAKDLEFSTREAEIKAMNEGNAKRIAQIELNKEREMDAIDRSYEDLRINRINEAKKLWDAEPSNKGKNFYESDRYKYAASDDRYTDEERANRIAKIKATAVEYQRSVNDVKNDELQVLYDYLKEFGSIEEKKLAITKEYEQKIAEEQDPTKRAVLRLRQDEKLEALSQEQVAQKIDWSGIFSDLSGHTKTYLEGLREQLQGLISDGGMRLEDMEVAQEKIRDINALISEQGTFFTSLSPLQIEYNRRLQEEADAKARLEVAQKEQSSLEAAVSMSKAAMQQYLSDNGIKDTGGISKGMANPFKANTKEYEAFNKMLEVLKVNEGKLAKAREKTNKATLDAKQAEDGTKQTAKQKWEKFQDSKTFQGVMANVSEAPGLLSNLGLGKESEKAQKGLNGLNDAMGAATDFFTGNYIGALSKGISAVTNFGEAFGLWSNSNRAEVEAANNKLQIATDVNTEAINRLTDAIKSESPMEAVKSWEQAQKLMELNEKNRQQTMSNNAGMYDGGHSLWYDFKEEYGERFIKELYNIVGKRSYDNSYDIGSAVHDFSGEDWNKILREYPEKMTKLGQMIADVEDQGNYNGMFKDIMDFAKEYSKEAYAELKNTLNESITGVSFDSFKEKFKSSLMDMKKDAKGFSDDFTEMLMQSVLDAKIEDMFGDEMSNLYDQWVNALSDNSLTDYEVKRLQEKQDDLVKRMIAERDMLAAMTGYDNSPSSDKSATYSSAEKATYDQFDTFLGIATSQQIALEHIKDMMSGMTGDGLSLTNMNLEHMLSLAASQCDIASESRDLLANSYLELKEANEHLETIEKSVVSIKGDVQETRRIIKDRL